MVFSNCDFISLSIKKSFKDNREDELLKEITTKYMINVNKIEKNEESVDGNVYILYNNKNKYVAKIYQNLNHTKAMVNLHLELLNNGINVPKIIKNNYDENYIELNNGGYVVIYSYLKGMQIGKKFKKIPKNVIKNIAIQLSRFHNVTSNSNKYNLKELPFSINSDIKRCSVLHFDLTKMNIFFKYNIGCKISFIDFDDAKYGPSICDVAIAISNLFFSKKYGVDIKGVNSFINSYYKDNTDLKLIELPYIKEIAIKWIDYVMDGNEFDTSTTESFIVKKELIEKIYNKQLYI